jgi:CubicO group peptidase (beta-lactamase class C family)
MTAAGVMLLRDSGAFALGDPMRKFIPEFTGGDRGRYP